MTLDEILAGINEYAGDDAGKAKEIATAIREKAKPVAQVLINVGGALTKSDATAKVTKAEGERDTAMAERDQLQVDLDELKTKTPDAKSIEEKEKAKWEAKVKKAETERDTERQRAAALEMDTAIEKVLNAVSTPDDQGLFVKRRTAKALLVTDWKNQIVAKEGGGVDLLQFDEKAPYDGKTLDEQVAAFAKDARKRVDPEDLITSTDTGGGVGGGGGGGGGGGSYDPVKAGQEMAESQKKQGENKSLAFR